MQRLWVSGPLALLGLIAVPFHAYADAKECVKEWYRTGIVNAVPPPEAIVESVRKIEDLFGVSHAITVLMCPSADKAESTYMDGKDPEAPRGEYVVYSPSWLRELAGENVAVQTFVFAHEVGHVLGRHFTAGATKEKLRREVEADKFGGCVMARLGYKWDTVEEVLGRIRGTVDTTYPSFTHATEAAEESFAACQSVVDEPPQVFDEAQYLIDKLREDSSGSSSLIFSNEFADRLLGLVQADDTAKTTIRNNISGYTQFDYFLLYALYKGGDRDVADEILSSMTGNPARLDDALEVLWVGDFLPADLVKFFPLAEEYLKETPDGPSAFKALLLLDDASNPAIASDVRNRVRTAIFDLAVNPKSVDGFQRSEAVAALRKFSDAYSATALATVMANGLGDATFATRAAATLEGDPGDGPPMSPSERPLRDAYPDLPKLSDAPEAWKKWLKAHPLKSLL